MATAAPTSELGYVNPSTGWAGSRGFPDDQAEETAAWMWPASVLTCDRMRRNSTVAMVLAAVTGPLRRPGLFVIDPQGADPAKVALLAEDLDLPVLGTERPPPLRRRGRFSWTEHLRLALLELVYGHMGFELLYRQDVLEATGAARLWKLAPRFPRSIAEISVATDGGLESITQHWTGRERPKPIPVANLVWYAHEREGAAWQGRSMLRPCYGNWLRLDRLLRARAYLMERQSSGMPVGKAPPGPNGGPSLQEDVDRMQEIASASRSGDQSGVGVPHGGDLTFEGIRGTLPDINAAIADERAQLADAVMAAWLRLGTSEASGNRALGETFVDQFTLAEQTIAGDVAGVVTQHVVEDWWDWNYGETDPAPAVIAQAVDAQRSSDDLAKRVEAAAVLIRAGYDPQAALVAVGLDPIKHLGFLPVTLQSNAEAAPPPPDPATLAAGRRARRVVRQSYDSTAAAKSVTWSDRVAEALSSYVDSEAIAAAAAAGTEAQKAVAAGLSVTDTAALAALLVELWGEGYGAGQDRATETAPATAAARRPSVVMASLSDMIARAGEIASGILGSLADRLGSLLGGDDVDADALAAAAGDAAAAERIAATEYHRATISGAVDTWASMGITATTWVRTSGSDDSDECAALDGTTSASWGELPPLHPNCECLLEPA